MAVSSDMVEQIVQNVLAGLRGQPTRPLPASSAGKSSEVKPETSSSDKPVFETIATPGRLFAMPMAFDSRNATPSPTPTSSSDTLTSAARVVKDALTAASPTKPSPTNAAVATAVVAEIPTLTQSVITADLLATRVRGVKVVQVPAKAIITPAARDWLATHRVEIRRSIGSVGPSAQAGASSKLVSSPAAATPATTANWVLGVVTVTGAVRSLLEGYKRGSPFSNIRLLGAGNEAIEFASSLINKGEAAGLILIVERSERVACLLNRSPKVRAAAVYDRLQAERAATQMGANVLCISPSGKSFIDLRNIGQQVVAAGVPRVPADWEAGV